MKGTVRILAFYFALLWFGWTGHSEVVGTNGAIATVHPLATDAALQIVRSGGNAVDAGVAAALTLGVVDGHNSGIGGGCFFLLRTSRGSLIAIDGRETAPAKATREMFIRDGKAVPELSQSGALAIGIPGSLAAYDYALRHFGKLKLKEVIRPAIRLAEEGFLIDTAYASRLQESAEDLAKFNESSRVLLKEGRAYEKGEILKQPDLARSYRAIAEHGIDWFYKGEFAERTEKWMGENGGLVTAEDFRKYEIRIREPIRSRYRGYEIIGFPPPSSGGVHVAQILNILENFELGELPAYSADPIHLIAEAMKLAFADRAYWLGDPDFVKVPRGLISRSYASSLAKKIDLAKASVVESHGPAASFGTANFENKHTTHFSVADAEGNWVACTTTVNTSFGSKVIIPGTGIILNNQMDDFSAQPGAPNFFGLVGAEANAIEPGKRPLSSMSPTIVLHRGRPVMALGAAGGPTIISQTVVNLINLIDYKMPLEKTLASPRIHHQWKPAALRVEELPYDVLDDLKNRGHEIITVKSSGAAQVVIQSGNRVEAAHDPRLAGKAAGW